MDYIRFTLTPDEIQPAAEMTESIRNLPAPKNITQARAFFGLVEQVSFLKCVDMSHFRHLLSPKSQFIWTEDLEREFGLAKASIVRKIHKGVTMFEVDRITALMTDWLKEGQSLGLWPKHCSCNCKGDITILCCRGGWKNFSWLLGSIMMLSLDIVRTKANVCLCFGPLIRLTTSCMGVTIYMSAPTIDHC
jgi:hypothetical protein